MSIRDDVLSALNPDIGTSVDAVVEETGLERLQVTKALRNLKLAGRCQIGRDGWSLTVADSTASALAEPAPKPSPRTASVPPVAKQPAKRAASVPKPKPKAATPVKLKYNRRDRGAPIAQAINGSLTFSLTEARAVVIERKDGSGERAIVEAGDALRLADFLALVRPALEEVER